MSSSSFRRRTPPISALSSKRRQNLSPSPRRKTPPKNRGPSKPSKYTRCSSEPNLLTSYGDGDCDGDGDDRSVRSREGEAVIFRPHTFSEAFASSPLLIPSPRRGSEVRVRARLRFFLPFLVYNLTYMCKFCHRFFRRKEVEVFFDLIVEDELISDCESSLFVQLPEKGE